MGTRSITAVVHDGKIKISQYGQWDGYYDYTGKGVLQFCREYLKDDYSRGKFTESVNLCKQVTKSFDETMRTIEKRLSRENDKEFCVPLNQLFPQMSRDTGFKILEIIYNLEPYMFKSVKDEKTEEIKRVQFYPIQLCLNTDGEEYTNVIDLDNNMVYLLTCHDFKGEALSTIDLIQNTYKRQKCYLKFSLDNIPDEDTVDHQVEALEIE